VLIYTTQIKKAIARQTLFLINSENPNN